MLPHDRRKLTLDTIVEPIRFVFTLVEMILFKMANCKMIGQWVNGRQVTEHSGGFLPFQADVTFSLVYGALNRITVAINNTLTDSTLPQGARTVPSECS